MHSSDTEADLNDTVHYTRFDRYLAGSEHVVYTCRRHWVVLAKPVLLWLGTIAASMLVSLAMTGPGGRGPIKDLVGIAFLVVTVYVVIMAGEWWWDEYVITNKRVIKLEGILNKKVSTIPLGKITDTAYRRTWLGRLLGYGDLVLDLPGQDKYLPVLNRLSRPDAVYKTIMSIAMGGAPQPPRKGKPPSEEDTGPIPVVE